MIVCRSAMADDLTKQMEALRRRFSGDRFAATSGVELLDLRPGYAKARLEVHERHLNGVNIVQGGAVFTLQIPLLDEAERHD